MFDRLGDRIMHVLQHVHALMEPSDLNCVLSVAVVSCLVLETASDTAKHHRSKFKLNQLFAGIITERNIVYCMNRFLHLEYVTYLSRYRTQADLG